MYKAIMLFMVLAICANAHAAKRLKPTFIFSNGSTIVASAVVTDAPYQADKTGKSDATAAIQRALDDVAEVGGGVVYMPAGRYRIEGSLKLGYATALVGEWKYSHDGNIGMGTILLAYGGRDKAEGDALLLATSSETALMNLTIYYPEQKPDDIRPYPPTISSFMSTLQNLILCNSYFAIDQKSMNASFLSDIYSTALVRGLYAPESQEFSWIRDVHFDNFYWKEAVKLFDGKPMTAAQAAMVDAYAKAHLVGLELQRLDALAIDGFSAKSAQVPIRMAKNPKYPHPVFGYGGVAMDFKGQRDEQGWAPWYYYMRYANVDNVPEIAGIRYFPPKTPTAKRVDKSSFYDVTQPPYNAMGDGIADDTAAVKKALSAASKRGGGTVYLPQGHYRITSPLVIPTGVELRGPYAAGKMRAFKEGCALEVYCGKGSIAPETDTAFITLQANSGIRGFTISHPEQSFDVKKLVSYPYTIRGNGSNVYIMDVDLLNSTYGIDFATNRCDGHLVRGMWATVLFKGINVGANSRDGKLERMAFSVGPFSESGRYAAVKTEETNTDLRDFISNNLVCYLFGDSVNEKGWGLVSFLPLTHYEFYEDKGQGCTNANFWLSMHDVGKRFNILANSGKNISLIGYFCSGSGEGKYNWLEVGPAFKGPLNVYAKTVQQSGINHPYGFSSRQVAFYEETSLTTGKNATAIKSADGNTPAKAVDRDPRSFWQAPAGSDLDVDLGQTRTITGFGLVNAGLFDDLKQNAEEAELWTSADGQDYTKAETVYVRPGGALQPYSNSWADCPVTPVTARYVRLKVTKPGADGIIRISTFNVFGY